MINLWIWRDILNASATFISKGIYTYVYADKWFTIITYIGDSFGYTYCFSIHWLFFYSCIRTSFNNISSKLRIDFNTCYIIIVWYTSSSRTVYWIVWIGIRSQKFSLGCVSNLTGQRNKNVLWIWILRWSLNVS